MWNEFLPISMPTTATRRCARSGTLRAPCLGAPGQLIAGRAGARPDHPFSGHHHVGPHCQPSAPSGTRYPSSLPVEPTSFSMRSKCERIRLLRRCHLSSLKTPATPTWRIFSPSSGVITEPPIIHRMSEPRSLQLFRSAAAPGGCTPRNDS